MAERRRAAGEQEPTAGEQALNLAKFVGDTAVLPGISRFVEGQVGSGITYATVVLFGSLAGRLLIGPTAGTLIWIGTGVASFYESVTGKAVGDIDQERYRKVLRDEIKDAVAEALNEQQTSRPLGSSHSS